MVGDGDEWRQNVLSAQLGHLGDRTEKEDKPRRVRTGFDVLALTRCLFYFRVLVGIGLTGKGKP